MDAQLDYAYRNLQRELEELTPDLIERIYPRKFQHGDQWPSPKYLAAMGMDTAAAANKDFVILGHEDKVLPHVYYTLGRLIENQTPTYFVYPKLLTALQATRLPSDMTLKDLPWPHQAALFVMPRWKVRPPDEGDCWYLAIARTPNGKPTQIIPRLESRALITSHDWVTTFAYIYGGQSYAWGHYLNDDPLDVGWQDPVFQSMDLGKSPEGELEISWRQMKTDELLFNRRMMSLAMQLMMVLTSRPDMVEPMRLVQAGKIVHGVKKPDIWKPAFLGKSYETRCEWQGGTHASPGIHHRDGHWRNYKVVEGKPWKQERSIWIEPTFVFPK